MLSVAGVLFGWEAALYSIIFQFVSTNVINYLHKDYSKATLNIITTKPDEIINPLMAYTHHAISRFEGVGCYSKTPRTLLYIVVSESEVKDVVHFGRQYDPQAFINIQRSEGLEGRFYHEPIE